MVSPNILKTARKLCAVVGEQVFRTPTLCHQTVQRFDHVFSAQANTDVNRQRFPRKDIDHGQCPEAPSAIELIRYEIETPYLIGASWNTACFPLRCHLETLRWALTQGKAIFPIRPIDKIIPDLPAFTIQHDPDPPIAEPHPAASDLLHALPQPQTRVAGASIALHRTVLSSQPTGPPLPVSMVTCQIRHHFTFHRGPGNFFDRTSCKIALSRLSSATNFFNRLFSS